MVGETQGKTNEERRRYGNGSLVARRGLRTASAAMALAAWAVLRTSSECSRAEEAAMLPPAPSGFRGGDPS